MHTELNASLQSKLGEVAPATDMQPTNDFARAVKKLGYEVAIINNNPETVSTDFDTADRLYFEPLTPPDVMNVINDEKPLGVVVAFGGGTAIKLAKYLDSQGVRILGTSASVFYTGL